MARSYKHTPICGITTARSEKEDKRIANRTLRTNVRQALATCSDFDELVLPVLREVSSVWGFAKDGKHRFDPNKPRNAKLMRK